MKIAKMCKKKLASQTISVSYYDC